MQAEFLVWQVVKSGMPLTEVNRWDLEDVDKYIALQEMQRDSEMAWQMLLEKESEK